MTPEQILAEWQRRYDAQMAALRTPPAKALIEMDRAAFRQEIERRLKLAWAEHLEKEDAEQEELLMHGDPNAQKTIVGVLRGRR